MDGSWLLVRVGDGVTVADGVANDERDCVAVELGENACEADSLGVPLPVCVPTADPVALGVND